MNRHMDACERREQLLKTVRESERCGRVGKKHACRAQQDRNAQNYEKRVEYSFEINMDEMKINEQCLAFTFTSAVKRMMNSSDFMPRSMTLNGMRVRSIRPMSAAVRSKNEKTFSARNITTMKRMVITSLNLGSRR